MISCSIRARRRGGLGWETLARSHEATRRTQHRDGGALLSLPPPPPPSRGAGGRGGLGSQGMCPAERTGPSTRCACPDVWRCSTWCRLPRPAQSRPARSAWVRVVAVLRPLIRWRPPRGVASSGKRELNRSLCEGPMRVRGAGLPIERWGHLQLYQGEWNAISAFLGPPPDILGQDPVPAGTGCSSCQHAVA